MDKSAFSFHAVFFVVREFFIWKLVCTIDKIDKMRHIIRIFLHHHHNLRRFVCSVAVLFFYYSIDRTSKSQPKIWLVSYDILEQQAFSCHFFLSVAGIRQEKRKIIRDTTRGVDQCSNICLSRFFRSAPFFGNI